MNKSKCFNAIFCAIFMCISCNNSNALKAVNAEKVIREFVTTHQVLTQQQELHPDQILRIEKPNVYSQFYTSVKVAALDNSQQTHTLLFDFKRSPENKWVLQTVESADNHQDLTRRIIVHKNVNISTQ